MRRHYRLLAAALCVGAATAALAQTHHASPLIRGDHRSFFFFEPLDGSQHSQFGQSVRVDVSSGIGKPHVQDPVPVTPVPEPSEWAMMLAGLALVGFIVRRNADRS
jgi:hypothetical protein